MIRNDLQTLLRKYGTAEIISLHNDFVSAIGRNDDYICEMDLFNDYFSGVDPLDIALKIFYGSDDNGGDFNPNRNYFYFNGCGNLVSIEYADFNQYGNKYNCSLISESEMLDYILENNESFGHSDIQELLDAEATRKAEAEELKKLQDAYTDYKKTKQDEFNKLPIFFAFGRDQFKKAMEEHGLLETDTDKIYALGNGGYYLRTDAQIIRDYFNKKDDLTERMKEHDFAVGAFWYEMNNHEYVLNLQGDFDVLSCFVSPIEYGDNKSHVDYLTESNLTELIPFYEEAAGLHGKDFEQWDF